MWGRHQEGGPRREQGVLGPASLTAPWVGEAQGDHPLLRHGGGPVSLRHIPHTGSAPPRGAAAQGRCRWPGVPSARNVTLWRRSRPLRRGTADP